MKLEAGKKYVLRNGNIEKCLAVWTECIGGYQATVTNHPDGVAEYAIDGKYHRGGEESLYDIVAEYRGPKKFESWVKLFDNGTALTFASLQDCENHLSIAESAGITRVVERRKIEWEVNE